MKPLVLIAATALLAVAPHAWADAPGPGAGMSHHHGRHGHAHARHHYGYRSAQLPGVLGMERGGVLYWRPAVDPMPEHVVEIAEPTVTHRRAIRALY
ncbi:hypothetical protein [Alsobacter sp. R-9]